MSVSVNPVTGFNFLESASSVFGVELTLTPAGTASRSDTNGLEVEATGERFSVLAPVALKAALPLTLMVRVNRVGAGSGGDAGCGVSGAGAASWRYAHNDRGTASPWRARYDNAGTLVTLTTTDTPVNPETETYFLQFTASAVTTWAGTTQVGESAAARTAPLYTNDDVLYFGSPPWAGDASGLHFTHAAIWNAVLTSDDRIQLAANPMAYASGTPYRPRTLGPTRFPSGL